MKKDISVLFLLTLCSLFLINCRNQSANSSIQLCNSVLEVQGAMPTDIPSLRIDRDANYYVLDRGNRQVMKFNSKGIVIDRTQIPAELKDKVIIDFAVIDDGVLISTTDSLVKIQADDTPLEIALPTDEATLASCSSSLGRHSLHILTDNSVVACINGLAPSRSIAHYSVAGEWEEIYLGELPHYAGVAWISAVVGWDGVTYIQQSNNIHKLDEHGSDIGDLVIEKTITSSPKGLLTGVDATGALYFYKSPNLTKFDSDGVLLWTRKVVLTSPLDLIEIDSKGNYYYWVEQEGADTPTKLMKCEGES